MTPKFSVLHLLGTRDLYFLEIRTSLFAMLVFPNQKPEWARISYSYSLELYSMRSLCLWPALEHLVLFNLFIIFIIF